MEHGEQLELATEVLPFPVAAPYRLFLNESQPSTALYRTFDVLEASLRFLAYCHAAELADNESVDSLKPLATAPMSLGSLHHWLLRSRKRESATLGIGVVDAVFDRKSGDTSFQEHVQELIAIRNRTRGHGVVRGERESRRLLAETRLLLDALMECIVPLSQQSLLIVKGVNDFDGQWHEHQVYVAMGDNPYFSIATLRTDKALPFRRVYLSTKHKLLPLYPLLRYELCPECEEDHLFLFQASKRNYCIFLEPAKGCELQLTLGSEKFLDMIVTGAETDVTVGTGVGPEPSRVAPGRLLANRYRLDRRLGAGGGGEVFEAWDTEQDKAVAVKIVSHEPTESQNFGSQIERFQREARAVASMQHPNLVEVHDVGVDGDAHFFVMDLVRGETMAQVIRRGPLASDEAVDIACQVLAALQVAHSKGIVHRDIKPSNVILDEDDQAKVMDFGVARLTSLTTLTGDQELVGTAGYMAPEQIDSGEVDPRADIFSVGVLLYELLTTHRPFQGATFQETLGKILRFDPPGPSKIQEGVPGWLDHAVLQFLAKSPNDRPATTEEAQACLEAQGEDRWTQKGRKRLKRLKIKLFGEPLDFDRAFALEAEGLHFRYGWGSDVLRGLNLRIPRGRRLCVLGRNGAGKTTLTKCLGGQLAPTKGTVRWFGSSQPRRVDLNSHLGYIPEDVEGLPFLTVTQYLTLLARTYPKWDHAYVTSLVSRWQIDLGSKIRNLSRGQKTLVLILAALGHRPPLLILDDPTLGLDAIWMDEFFHTLRRHWSTSEATLVFTTHSFEMVKEIGNRVAFLHEGAILLEADLEKLLQRFHRVTLVLADDRKPSEGLPHGFTTSKHVGRSVEGILDAYLAASGHNIEDAFSELSPEAIHVRQPSLKEIYVHLIGEGRSKQLYSS